MKHPNRPRDVSQHAKLIVDIVTGQVEDGDPDEGKPKPRKLWDGGAGRPEPRK